MSASLFSDALCTECGCVLAADTETCAPCRRAEEPLKSVLAEVGWTATHHAQFASRWHVLDERGVAVLNAEGGDVLTLSDIWRALRERGLVR